MNQRKAWQAPGFFYGCQKYHIKVTYLLLFDYQFKLIRKKLIMVQLRSKYYAKAQKNVSDYQSDMQKQADEIFPEFKKQVMSEMDLLKDFTPTYTSKKLIRSIIKKNSWINNYTHVNDYFWNLIQEKTLTINLDQIFEKEFCDGLDSAGVEDHGNRHGALLDIVQLYGLPIHTVDERLIQDPLDELRHD